MYNACGDPGCGGCPLCRGDVPVLSGQKPVHSASLSFNWTVTQTDISYLLPLEHSSWLSSNPAANGD